MGSAFVYILLFINLLTFYSVITKPTNNGLNTSVCSINNYYYQKPFTKFDFTVVSQSSYERVHFLPHWSDRWQGSMSITFILTNETFSEFHSIMDTLLLPYRIHIIPYMTQNVTIYPINTLRNIAIDHVNTTHFWLADMDMWPSYDLYSTLLSLPSHYLKNEKVATIVPAFEYSLSTTAHCISFEQCIKEVQQFLPSNKKDLLHCMKTNNCTYFRVKTKTHNYHFKQWKTLPLETYITPVKCLMDGEEPYVVVRLTDNLPRFDERFVNYGKNKVQWITHLRYAGYQFNVLSHSFAIDVPHPRSNMSVIWFKEHRSRGKTEMGMLMNRFKKDLLRKYSSTQISTPLCNIRSHNTSNTSVKTSRK